MLCEWTSTALKRALTTTNIRAGFRRVDIWPLDRDASKSAMALLTGFEEGVAGLQSCGATSATDHSVGGVTCPTSHLQAANGPVTGQADHELSMHIDATCMHAAQTEDDGRDSSSDDADVDPVGVRYKGKEEGTLGALDGAPPR